MASKKSSIPRAAHDCNRPDATKSKLIVPKPPAKPYVSHSLSKPPVNDGLLQEDNDAVRRSLLHLEEDHARMKQTLEDTVREAEERLEAMKHLMEEREKWCASQLGAASDRTEELEQQIDEYEQTLVENNIDPVTGQVMEPTEEEAVKIQKVKKVTKKDVVKMREKLQELNENSDKYLIDVQNILQDIAEVEATSQRAGGRPTSTPMAREDMMTLIKEVEEAQAKEEKERKKKKKEEGKEDDSDEEEEGEEEEKEGAWGDVGAGTVEEKDVSRPQSKSELFITQK